MIELPKEYQSKLYEQKIYSSWEADGVFSPIDNPDADTFSLMMPPPNVTGTLHIGHALGATIQDIMTRYHRMLGHNTLYLPGTDHAGIATQAVVEKHLAKQNIRRQDLGREKFVKEVESWKEQYHDRITGQLRALGVSADWSREVYTLDEARYLAVNTAFKTLYDRGLIYQGNYLVNWSVKGQTAISDEEVEYEDRDGQLWYVKYPLKDQPDKYITVATTRPETMLGDTAVAVHPDDKRYQSYIGQFIKLPLTDRSIPIVADKIVDIKFGTGAVKVTPAHDRNDWEIRLRHNLELINIIDQYGRMNNQAPEAYRGLKVAEAREKVVSDLDSQSLIEKIETIKHRVGISQRHGDVVEPLVSKQWFVKMGSMAKKALEAVKSGKINIQPKRFEKIYFHWLNNIRDWCISRQLWWGHQIPVWHRGEEIYVDLIPPEGDGWVREEDVLDTWFSSALWPYSTLGWPNESSPDYKRFFPNSDHETGYDILFFWTAKMIMLSLELTNQVPFKNVYLHGLVRDEHGRKMSKSLGNVVEPIELIERWGCDAVRMALVIGTSPGNDVNFSESRAKGYRNFANKIWNASRFVLSRVEVESIAVKTVQDVHLTDDDKADLKQLDKVIASATKNLSKCNFSQAGDDLYHYFWHTFADVIIERNKSRLEAEESKDAASFVLWQHTIKLLKALHPFMPFVTEAIWQQLPFSTRQDKYLMLSAWPK